MYTLQIEEIILLKDSTDTLQTAAAKDSTNVHHELSSEDSTNAIYI